MAGRVFAPLTSRKFLVAKGTERGAIHNNRTHRRKMYVIVSAFDQLTGLDVPELDGAVVGGGDHELGVELEAGHRGLVLVRT